jgi:hypothetical protein
LNALESWPNSAYRLPAGTDGRFIKSNEVTVASLEVDIRGDLDRDLERVGLDSSIFMGKSLYITQFSPIKAARAAFESSNSQKAKLPCLGLTNQFK